MGATEANGLDHVQNASAHGTNGKCVFSCFTRRPCSYEKRSIHFSYPPSVYYDQLAAWIPTFGNMGVNTRDPAGGVTQGAFLATTAINRDGNTRSVRTSSFCSGRTHS